MKDVDALNKKYMDLFPADMPIPEVSEKLNVMPENDETTFFRETFCNELVYGISAGYIEYGGGRDFKEDPLIRIFIINAKKLPKTDSFFHMLSAFFAGKHQECLNIFDLICEEAKKEIEAGRVPYNEAILIDGFIEPMKEAFPGFWRHAQEKLEKLCENDGSQELCRLMACIYSRKSDDEGVDILTAYIQKYPDIIVAKEYLACLYFNLKMYQNAIAWYESIGDPDNTMLFAMCPARREALLGDVYGKIRNYREEEKYYRKALELDPKIIYVANNLGYSLYKQKRYLEALDVLKSCLEEEKDLPYAANNYLRTLIALGRYKDAKTFIRENGYKITKSLTEKVKGLPDTNQRIIKREIEEEPRPKEKEDSEETRIDTAAVSARGSQFNSEKLLEDELTQRIENGVPVFGMKLKMYKRPGEYGRQYIIPVGRLDLFCEDGTGNLYVIELKKDSGYDDAYKQTADYLDWFENSPKFKDKKIFGIICLNNPSEELISKVRKDARIQLFEYQVSYTEII